MPDGILLSVLGRDYYVSYDRMPWFRSAKLCDVFNVELCCGNTAVRWNALDVGLEVESLKHPERYPLLMKRTEDERETKN
jgi:hypothetical protein